MISDARRSWPRHRRRGVTLVEIIAALALLGTLFVATVLARGRYVQQWQLAERRLTAVNMADQLLEQWWRNIDGFPRAGYGRLDEQMQWRTMTINREPLEGLASHIVRLEIFEQTGPGVQEVLSRVDVLLPEEEESPDTNTEGT